MLNTHAHRFLTITSVVLPFALASCGGGVSASKCRAAATAQAQAEDAYIATIAAHEEAHTAGNDDHRDIDEQTLTRRVDLIVATEATRQACQ